MKQIKGFEHYLIDVNGVIYNSKFKRYIKVKLEKSGYLRVQLHNKCNKNFYLHRLIAETFIENPNNLKSINHINGIKTDNRIENLEWCTPSENLLHAYSNGLKQGHNKLFKIILDNETGIFYNGIKEAAKAKNLNFGSLYSLLNGNRKNNTSLIYV